MPTRIHRIIGRDLLHWLNGHNIHDTDILSDLDRLAHNLRRSTNEYAKIKEPNMSDLLSQLNEWAVARCTGEGELDAYIVQRLALIRSLWDEREQQTLFSA